MENGDFNWIMKEKILAFAGPQSLRFGGKDKVNQGGRFLTPAYFIPYFKQNNIKLVIRLNKAYYEASEFTSHGIAHVDLYFPDGGVPSEKILLQ